jgi:hypothetical protein
LGRFINRDPIEEAGGNNLYAYAGGDPVNQHDYLGLYGYDDCMRTNRLLLESKFGVYTQIQDHWYFITDLQDCSKYINYWDGGGFPPTDGGGGEGDRDPGPSGDGGGSGGNGGGGDGGDGGDTENPQENNLPPCSEFVEALKQKSTVTATLQTFIEMPEIRNPKESSDPNDISKDMTEFTINHKLCDPSK